MMGKWWTQIGGKKYCHRGRHSTCYHARLYNAPPDSGVDRHIRVATEEINQILSTLEQHHAGPDRELAFLAVRESDENDILRLDWIYHDEEITTIYDGNY
jgi:hypothetical protein